MRDARGKPVANDTGSRLIDTIRHGRGKVKSREASKGEKPKPHIKDHAGPGSPKEVSGDIANNPEARKNPKAFPGDASEHLQAHHDRLVTIEKHLGLHHWGDDMPSQDQKHMGGKATGKHVTEKKGAQHYGRKRH